MAKGNASKEIIFQKILDTFKGSFMADAKTLRIPMEENGEPLEIKVTLTAAKDIIGDAAVGEDHDWSDPKDTSKSNTVGTVTPIVAEPTQEEKENVQRMLKNLGFL